MPRRSDYRDGNSSAPTAGTWRFAPATSSSPRVATRGGGYGRRRSVLELLEFITKDGGQLVVLLLECLSQTTAKFGLLTQWQLRNQ